MSGTFLRHLRVPCAILSTYDPLRSRAENWWHLNKLKDKLRHRGIPFKEIIRDMGPIKEKCLVLTVTYRDHLPSVALIAHDIGQFFNQAYYLIVDKNRRCFKHYIDNDQVEDIGHLLPVPKKVAEARDWHFYDSITEQYFSADNSGELLSGGLQRC